MYTLDQTDLHRQFCELVETRLDACLRKKGHSAEDLLSAIKRIDNRPSSSTSYLSMASREIVTALHEVDDFELWAKNMRERAGTRAGSDGGIRVDGQGLSLHK